MLTLILDGAGSVEVIEFCKVSDETAIILAFWSDQYVVWRITQNPRCLCGSPDCHSFTKGGSWVTGSGNYSGDDLILGRRNFQSLRHRLNLA